MLVRSSLPILLALAAIVSSVLSTSVEAAPRVTLEVMTEQGFPPTATHQWSKLLQTAGFDSVRIRGGRPGEVTGVETIGKGATATYRVTAMLSTKNKLLVPGQSFGKTEMAQLKKWGERLRHGGEDEIKQKTVSAFGLSKKELVEIYTGLGVAVDFSTNGTSVYESLKKISQKIPYEFSANEAAKAAMHRGKVLDELEGVGAGTATAAMLKPLGLSMLPKREGGGKIRLHIVRSNTIKEGWPVGWPPENKAVQVIPKLLKYLDVEIADITLEEALAAIAGNLGAPVLIDHNQLAAQQIDMSQVKSRYPNSRTYYKKILDTILSQGLLTFEVRIDELGHGIIWVTTLKKG
ncbi:MAG: hypothetical protein COA78_05345 [Blastopirellula sp.]|nr:MAG: hypothetical protein COA78_05345 [Blastopirellula sp.]